MNEERDRRQKMLYGLMAAVTLWGLLLALGALLFGYDVASGDVRLAPDWMRGGIVLLCVLGFLTIWWLAARRRFS